MTYTYTALFALLFCAVFNNGAYCKPPNIIMIVADDMGRNDVGLHGSSQIPTPNIDALGYNGVAFNKHYTMHICTPSRSALLTGNYPMRLGMQGFPLASGEPRSLPIRVATLAERLSALGYYTHMVGKWHLGHQNRSVTPLGRGFDSHLGYWNGFVGYFDYQIQESGSFNGFDLHDNYRPAFSLSGRYATDLFTEKSVEIIENHDQKRPLFLIINHLAAHTGKNGSELEVPNVDDAMENYQYIEEPQRRLYAEIVNRLDTSVGTVVKALADNGMLNNSIVVFMSDNGAQSVGFFQNFGSNWPLRGLKFTLYEGGVRNTAVMWSPLLKKKHHVSNTLFHITDWMPTLYAAAGGDASVLGKVDGINHWPDLSQGVSNTKRPDVLLNIDEVEDYEAILSSDGRYKLTKGSYKDRIYDDYYGDSGRSANVPPYNIEAILNSDVNKAILDCDETTVPLTSHTIQQMRAEMDIKQANVEQKSINCEKNYCLFDLLEDPTETTDIATDNTEIVAKLKASLDHYRTQLMPQTNKKVDPNSDPSRCFDTWHPWLEPVLKCVS